MLLCSEEQKNEERATLLRGDGSRAVHAGSQRHKPYHAVVDPIVQTAIYEFEDSAAVLEYQRELRAGKAERLEYSRYGSPTVTAVEARLAELEHAGAAVMFSSGMAAMTVTLLAFLEQGSHVILTSDCYKRTRQFCVDHLRRFGVETTVVPAGDLDALESAIRPSTRVLVSETPTNPYLRVLDLERFGKFGQRYGVLTLVDATFATPFNVRPIEWGVDLVMHSATKYLGGHHDLLAGVVAGRQERIAQLRQVVDIYGPTPDPQNAYLLLRGLKTLALRVRHQNESALQVATFLEGHGAVERVWYPGLSSHPEYGIAQRQMNGFGGVVSFNVRGDFEATMRVVDRLRIPYISPSLGGPESLVTQPALMTYHDLTTEQRRSLGIDDNLIRYAVGLEDAEDLIADLEYALALEV